MTKTILIGRGRRITLVELQALAFGGDAALEWNDGDLPPVQDAIVQGVLEELKGDKVSPAMNASLVLFAFSLAQKTANETKIATILSVLAYNTSLAFKAGNSLGLTQDTSDMAIIALYAVQASSLANVALPIAALSVERHQQVVDYSESFVDVARPHRGIVQAATTLRALLHSSNFMASATVKIPEGASPLPVLAQLPHSHGPAHSAMQQTCKDLELEINTYSTTGNVWEDQTLNQMSLSQAYHAVQVLHSSTMARCDKQVPSPTSMPTPELFQSLVEVWQQALEDEAKMGMAFCLEETKKAQAELASKQEKQQAKDQQQSQAPDQKDEFEGSTEAQKAKILKKRAEKEAKAQAKRKSKENKQVHLFGAAIVPLCEVLALSSDLSNQDTLKKIDEVSEKFTTGGRQQRKPKLPKGTRDYEPAQMKIRQQAFNIIRRVFESHGAVEIDTPVFELKDTLTGKYGEDSKLIYDLADQGGEKLALRYDLTVPFARFLALHSVGNIKRFHIGKVYRRDQPALAKGRYREFYQCDFDIAGVYGRMVPDSECLAVACDILDSLPIGEFGIKLNHRKLLDAILDLSGVPAEKFRAICSAVDKLDKEPWETVKKEMTEEKGLEDAVADKIGEFVLLKGEPWAMYNQLMESKKFGTHVGALTAMEDLRIVFEYLEAMGKLQFISFDLSLARGLDYYTGVIYEAVCMSGNTQVGSIGGGGRYDNLVSMFQESDKQTPCVGVSIGIERVFTLMEARLREEQGSIQQPNVSVLVASVGDGMIKERMKITRILWDAKISAEFSQKENPKLKFELKDALDRAIPYMVIVGEEELKEQKCKVKDLDKKTEDLVPISELVSCLRSKGVIPVGCEFAAEILSIKSP
jgi:histidyl-tRNA synthetase